MRPAQLEGKNLLPLPNEAREAVLLKANDEQPCFFPQPTFAFFYGISSVFACTGA